MVPSPDHHIIVLGGGGHAAHIIALIAASGCGQAVACYDDDARLQNREVAGVPVRGGVSHWAALAPGPMGAVVIGIGDPVVRKRLLDMARECGWKLPSIVHPMAAIASDAVIGGACVVDAGAVIGARACVGEGGIIDACATIAHDADLGDFVHLEPGARILSGAKVGSHALIGAGAVVQRNASVEDCADIAPLTLVSAVRSARKRN